MAQGLQARAIAPEGLAPRGSVRGFISDIDGWPLPRTRVVLTDIAGKEIGSAVSGREGKYEIPLEQPCERCTLTATRMGFVEQNRTFTYNGSNPLWFGFALDRQPTQPK